MKKLFIAFLLSVFCLSGRAAPLGVEAEDDGGEPNVSEFIDHENEGDGSEEKIFATDLLQTQKSAEPSSGIKNDRIYSDSKKTRPESDFKPRDGQSQKTQPDNPLPFDAFAEIEEAPLVISQNVSSRSGIDPVAASKEFIGGIVIFQDKTLIDEAMLEMVDDTVNIALNIKYLWNDLDRQVTYTFYQGAAKLGFDAEYSYYTDAGYQNAESESDLFTLVSDSDGLSHQNQKPEGFFTYVLFFPKFLTVSNFLLILGALFVLNGLYRVMRFFILRL